jgi:hypothetical protein
MLEVVLDRYCSYLLKVIPLLHTRIERRLRQVIPSTKSTSRNACTMASSTPALCSLDDFLRHDYDYLVVGGGTAGLCIAARLTENPDVKVGVLEAGSNRMDDPQVYTPSLYPSLIGREKYDWCFETTPQASAGGKKYSMPRGKLLGGSSGINYLVSVPFSW